MTLQSSTVAAPLVAEPATSEGRSPRWSARSYARRATSLLYAFSACFGLTFGVPPTPSHVLGVASLIVWTLVVAIAVKYATIVPAPT